MVCIDKELIEYNIVSAQTIRSVYVSAYSLSLHPN